MYSDDVNQSPSPTASDLQLVPPQRPGRGRRRDDTLPYNRARDVQRAFRARRAEHLHQLENRVVELEEENAGLREALSMPPADRVPLGQGPTGRGRPLAPHSRRSATHSSSESNPTLDEDMDDDPADGDSPPVQEASTGSIPAPARAASTQTPSPVAGTAGSDFQWFAHQAMATQSYAHRTTTSDAAVPALETSAPSTSSYPPTSSSFPRDALPQPLTHARSGHYDHPPPAHASRPTLERLYPASPVATLSSQRSVLPSPSHPTTQPRRRGTSGESAAPFGRSAAGLSEPSPYPTSSVPPAQQTEVFSSNYALPHPHHGQDAYRPLIKREDDVLPWTGGPRSDVQLPSTVQGSPSAYAQPRGTQPTSGWDSRVGGYPAHPQYSSSQPYTPQSGVPATQTLALGGWQASHPLQQNSTHYQAQQQSQYYVPRGP